MRVLLHVWQPGRVLLLHLGQPYSATEDSQGGVRHDVVLACPILEFGLIASLSLRCLLPAKISGNQPPFDRGYVLDRCDANTLFAS
jgi:hypothetical protein